MVRAPAMESGLYAWDSDENWYSRPSELVSPRRE